MNKTARELSRFSRKFFAGFLTLWLSGFIFLFCCEIPAVQAAEGEFCPLKKAQSHCDKTEESDDDSPIVSKESNEGNFDCCGFLPAVFDKARKIEEVQKAAQTASIVKVDLPRFAFTENKFEFSESYRPLVFSRDKIHIKNCVFRI